MRELVLSPPGLFELIQNYMWYICVINYTGIFATGFWFLILFFFFSNIQLTLDVSELTVHIYYLIYPLHVYIE